ncbi:MAG: glycerol-3-phosphate 1-O-acyltransferase PlsY [Anaerosomatales bacterium]|nr:glycerol-3-phosphate 1-O-acyltransferase PlsY [Coriobacteriia bacterium]MDI6692930.1 glycerol-3-phosphate 1-O-acyltransferase PlsY [Anaerosomatales bacterium]
MNVWLSIAEVVAVGLVLGSLPFAVIVSRIFFKTDIREHGSGNPGATNVFRTFGPAAGIAVLVLDVAKGAAAVAIARALLAGLPERPHDWGLVVCALAAIAGHSFSPFIGFRGGKGVATAAGAVTVIMPTGALVLLITFLSVLAVGRMVSLASIVLSLEFPMLVIILYGDRTALVLLGFATGALVFWRHHSNIRRIMRGEEPRLGRMREAVSP